MTQVQAFILGTLLSFAIATGVLLILRKRLTGVLTELCEHEERARFWVLMVNLTVSIAATLLSMVAGEGSGGGDPFWSVVEQLEYAMGGMIASLLVLAIVIGKSIARFEEREAAKHRRPPALPSPAGPQVAGGTAS